MNDTLKAFLATLAMFVFIILVFYGFWKLMVWNIFWSIIIIIGLSVFTMLFDIIKSRR